MPTLNRPSDVETSHATEQVGFTLLEASALLGLTKQAVRNRDYTVVSDARPMRLDRQEIVADFIQKIRTREAELADLREAGASFGIELEILE